MRVWIAAIGLLVGSVASAVECTDCRGTCPADVACASSPALAELTPTGDSDQPEWTTVPRFGQVKTYVRPAWSVGVESGWRLSAPRGGEPRTRLTQEFEVGLPYRLQLDYANTLNAFNEGDPNAHAIEVRWALADWGRIPGNPTLMAEWKFQEDAADVGEVKLLLGDNLTPRIVWALNLFGEAQVGDDRVREYGASLAAHYVAVDSRLSIGFEAQAFNETDAGDRTGQVRVLAGPSLNWRITPAIHVTWAPLFGASGRAPSFRSFLFVGVELGAEGWRGAAPVSSRRL